jgi:hypothetical protein
MSATAIAVAVSVDTLAMSMERWSEELVVVSGIVAIGFRYGRGGVPA